MLKEWGFLLKTLTMIDLYLTYVHVYSIHFNLKETSQQVGRKFPASMFSEIDGKCYAYGCPLACLPKRHTTNINS